MSGFFLMIVSELNTDIQWLVGRWFVSKVTQKPLD